MIKVLIVEDERHTARYIAQLVEQHPDFTVAGMAGNGADGLAFFEHSEADLVITDIRMPVMDGMEFLRHLHAMCPRCITAVLSGYSDFEYARAAIQTQALDYLLKPVDREALFRLLERVKLLWHAQEQEARKTLLRRALDGELLPHDTAEKVWLAVIQGHQLPPEPELGFPCQIFTGAAEQLVTAEVRYDVPGLLEPWLTKHHWDTPVNIICTQRPVPLWALHTTAENLRSILPRQVELFRSRLFLVNPGEEPSLRSGTYLRDMHPDRAVDAICTKKRAALRECLTQVLKIPGLRRMDAQNYLDAVISDTRLSYHMAPGKLSRAKATLAEIIARAESPDACAQLLTSQLMSLQNEPTVKQDMADLVEEIAQQMHANCHLPFTTEVLAAQYGLMPRYLNKVFKEHKGQRPMEYLLALRMQQARYILESTPDALIKDVANRVGYTDPLYFSKIFKRETGLWPKEVQQNIKK